jgi:hypothetical protein
MLMTMSRVNEKAVWDLRHDASVMGASTGVIWHRSPYEDQSCINNNVNDPCPFFTASYPQPSIVHPPRYLAMTLLPPTAVSTLFGSLPSSHCC